jgi:hypothetical protein
MPRCANAASVGGLVAHPAGKSRRTVVGLFASQQHRHRLAANRDCDKRFPHRWLGYLPPYASRTTCGRAVSGQRASRS